MKNQYLIYRYDAIQHPVEYHANQVNSNQLGRSIKWIVCLQILAIVVSLPLFLEPAVVLVTYTVRDNLNTSHIALVSYHYKNELSKQMPVNVTVNVIGQPE